MDRLPEGFWLWALGFGVSGGSRFRGFGVSGFMVQEFRVLLVHATGRGRGGGGRDVELGFVFWGRV